MIMGGGGTGCSYEEGMGLSSDLSCTCTPPQIMYVDLSVSIVVSL